MAAGGVECFSGVEKRSSRRAHNAKNAGSNPAPATMALASRLPCDRGVGAAIVDRSFNG